jgi:hypothetical protein
VQVAASFSLLALALLPVLARLGLVPTVRLLLVGSTGASQLLILLSRSSERHRELDREFHVDGAGAGAAWGMLRLLSAARIA